MGVGVNEYLQVGLHTNLELWASGGGHMMPHACPILVC